ncbi:unnamed protein product [Prorocentrum cordatum]|uniref:Uncharacterized protein n=1 Tax=Prorocentrum cordatum TaxID=2364126 RepID=A0ABN9THC6_9DINO|nr:unnamed protein product [Polarella glacialis]
MLSTFSFTWTSHRGGLHSLEGNGSTNAAPARRPQQHATVAQEANGWLAQFEAQRACHLHSLIHSGLSSDRACTGPASKHVLALTAQDAKGSGLFGRGTRRELLQTALAPSKSPGEAQLRGSTSAATRHLQAPKQDGGPPWNAVRARRRST